MVARIDSSGTFGPLAFRPSDSFNWHFALVRSQGRPRRDPALPIRVRFFGLPFGSGFAELGNPQAVSQLFLAQDQVLCDFLKIITHLGGKLVPGIANLFHNRILEGCLAFRVLQGCRLVGTHGLGFR
jgi:hypothetical protein